MVIQLSIDCQLFFIIFQHIRIFLLKSFGNFRKSVNIFEVVEQVKGSLTGSQIFESFINQSHCADLLLFLPIFEGIVESSPKLVIFFPEEIFFCCFEWSYQIFNLQS